jgi:hypothetical protein
MGMRIGGMSSTTGPQAWSSRALAAVSTTARGRPPASPARCSLVPCLPRSTGFAPVSAPFDRADAGGVDQDPLQVEAAGLAQFVQQHRLELLEHPCAGPLVQAAPAGGRAAAAQLLGGQQVPGGGGAGHKQQRGHAVAVGDMAGDAAAGARRWGRQPRLDTGPQLAGQESIHKAGHGRGPSHDQPELPKPPRSLIPECPLKTARGPGEILLPDV